MCRATSKTTRGCVSTSRCKPVSPPPAANSRQACLLCCLWKSSQSAAHSHVRQLGAGSNERHDLRSPVHRNGRFGVYAPRQDSELGDLRRRRRHGVAAGVLGPARPALLLLSQQQPPTNLLASFGFAHYVPDRCGGLTRLRRQPTS